MFGFPASTEFGKRIPKQKFYENIDVTPVLKRVFVEQIRLIYWQQQAGSYHDESCRRKYCDRDRDL